MAETKRMTAEQVVSYLMEEDGLDFLRESLTWVVQQLMEAEVSELVGAGHGERAPEERLTHRNGYRARSWATRAGEIELAIPKIRRGSYFPSFLEPRRRSEQALVSVVQEAYVAGVSTRKVDQVVESLGLRISKSEVSRICAGLDEQVEAFRNRPLEGRYPYLWLDAKVEKVRDGGRVVRKALGARLRRARVRLPRGDRPRRRRGRDRGVLAQLPPRPGRARPDRRAAGRLRRARRAEEGDRPGARLPLAALHRPLPARSARACPPRSAADAGRADPPDLQRRESASRRASSLGAALERLRKPLPKIAELLEEAEDDLLAFYAFPADHWPKLRSTNPLERVNREIGRRTDVVGIFPNDRSLIRLAASVVIEQNDEWLVGHRYLSQHSLDAILTDDKEDNNRKEARELAAA